MSHIKLFSDSTCDLPKELIKEHDIGIIPLYVSFGENSYKDGIDITPEKLYQMVDQYGELPKTSAPSPADFIKAFRPVIEAGQNIIFIGLSSELSSTYQNALIAASEFPKERIEIVDSLNLSNGIGLQVMKAINLTKAGEDIHTIAKRLREGRESVETEFIIDTLDYLYKGGRCNSVQHIMGSLLKLKPIVKVVDGKMILVSKVRGKREKVLDELLNHTLTNKEKMDGDIIFVAHSFSLQEAQYLQAKLLEAVPAKAIYIAEAGCVISSHCGPKTVGIIYKNK